MGRWICGYDSALSLGKCDCDGAAMTTTVLDRCYPDHLGTPRAITKATDNAKVWEWRNDDPFWNNAPNEDPSNTGTAFKYNNRFPGQYFDQETNTSYNYFRDYDPNIGSYVQSDRIGLRGGINTFGYVGGNPLRYTDRTGWLTDCEMKWLNDNYGYLGGFLTDLFNAQQYIPGLSDDLKGSLKTAAEVGAEKAVATKGVGTVGDVILSKSTSYTAGRIGIGLTEYAGLSSGVLEVAGAALTPFATTALFFARLNCIDPLNGKRCQ